MKPPLRVHMGAHGSIKILTNEPETGWDVVEQVVRQVALEDLDSFDAAIRTNDAYALDQAREDVGKLSLTIATLSVAEAEELAFVLLAVARELTAVRA